MLLHLINDDDVGIDWAKKSRRSEKNRELSTCSPIVFHRTNRERSVPLLSRNLGFHYSIMTHRIRHAGRMERREASL